MEFPPPPWVRALLSPAEVMYRGAVALRNALYDRHLLPIAKLSAHVVSVGNLSVGGSGKTPFVAYLAHALAESGRKVAIGSRGYGGASPIVPQLVNPEGQPPLAAQEAGDEPLLLALQVPSVRVVVGRDRVAVARFAAERLGCDVILLDDGFQHRRLHRDLDLLLMDAGSGFGNGRMLPCGPLREPVSQVTRADAVIVTGAASDLEHGAQVARAALTRRGLSTPVFRCARHLEGFSRVESEDRAEPWALQGMKAVAFSGIARPASFEADLQSLGVEVVASVRFRDHQPLGPPEMARIAEAVRRARPAFLVTTEKDKVRLGAQRLPIPAYALRIRMTPMEEENLMALVRRHLVTQASSSRRYS